MALSFSDWLQKSKYGTSYNDQGVAVYSDLTDTENGGRMLGTEDQSVEHLVEFNADDQIVRAAVTPAS